MYVCIFAMMIRYSEIFFISILPSTQLITRPDIKIFLPPIGGLTIYIWGENGMSLHVNIIFDSHSIHHSMQITNE